MTLHQREFPYPAELTQALRDHGLKPDGPSQLADAFRCGWLAMSKSNAARLAEATGDSVIPATLNEGLLADEVRRLHGIVSEVHRWVVCGCIAPPEDMAQNFERITEITAPDYAGHGGEEYDDL